MTNLKSFRLPRLIRDVKIQGWMWLHFKLALLVWSILLYHFTPVFVMQAQGSFITGLMTFITGIGAIVSGVGLILKNQEGEVGLVGTEIELAGLCFMAAGPFTYLVTQIYLAFTLVDGDQRFALCAFIYAMCAVLVCRIALVFGQLTKAMREPKGTV